MKPPFPDICAIILSLAVDVMTLILREATTLEKTRGLG